MFQSTMSEARRKEIGRQIADAMKFGNKDFAIKLSMQIPLDLPIKNIEVILFTCKLAVKYSLKQYITKFFFEIFAILIVYSRDLLWRGETATCR